MRKVKEQQMKFGEVDIATVEFDLRFRYEIPKLLSGIATKKGFRSVTI